MPLQIPVDVTQSDGARLGATTHETVDGRESTAGTADLDTGHSADDTLDDTNSRPGTAPRFTKWKRIASRAILPGLALMLAVASGYLKFLDGSSQDVQRARIESVHAASEATTAMLSYQPDTAEKDLSAAQERMTGSFRDSYAGLIHDVVIPGAKQRQISAAATVPAATSVSASQTHAVVLVFVNQTITVGHDAPSGTASSVRVSLDYIHGRWLISAFDPI